jgi:hypothetical protein
MRLLRQYLLFYIGLAILLELCTRKPGVRAETNSAVLGTQSSPWAPPDSRAHPNLRREVILRSVRRRAAGEGENGEETTVTSSATGASSNSISVATVSAALIVLLAVAFQYMGIIDVSALLPFLEMANNDCEGANGVDDDYVTHYNDVDEGDDY